MAKQIDLDSGVKIVPGKRVMYRLTDDERVEGYSGKCPAVVVSPAKERSPKGQRQALIAIFAPSGEVLFKVAPSDNAREPGTFDSFQVADETDEGLH